MERGQVPKQECLHFPTACISPEGDFVTVSLTPFPTTSILQTVLLQRISNEYIMISPTMKL